MQYNPAARSDARLFYCRSTLDTIVSPAPASRIELEVQRIQALQRSRQFAEALQAAELLATEVAENRDVLYLLAVSQRYLQRIPAALATLERLERHHPGFSRLYQERGHCRVFLKDAPAAINASATSTPWLRRYQCR